MVYNIINATNQYGLQVRRLNREAGVSPARSRRCKEEQPSFMSLAKAGKAKEAMNLSQKNCL